MRRSSLIGIAVGITAGLAVFALAPGAGAQGDGTFQAPLTILNAGRPGPSTVHAGDLNRDGKLDLITANGNPSILIFFQDPSSRLDWRQVPVRVGSTVWFVRAGDFNGDGFEDIAASDINSTAYFIRSVGDGTFARPEPLAESRGARWIAVGDWNRDGKLDLATANISAADLTVFLGDGAGKFALSHRLPGSREHSLEALDYDGDGILDLMLGMGLEGINPYRGLGDGRFVSQDPIMNLGCVEYLAEAIHFREGRLIVTGDFNKDGKGDLSPTCVETTSAFAGISRGDATYQKVLEVQAGPDVDSTAIADLNGDGNADLAVASKGHTTLLVHLGKGDGSFLPDPVSFGPTGETPSFLIARDLDGDGRIDVVSGDTTSSTITVFWGKEGERFLESGIQVAGFNSAKSMAVADLDGDRAPDLLVPRSDQPAVDVYLKPGLSPASRPSLTIATTEKFTLLEAADLDGDGIPDLAGADPVSGKAVAAFLDREGKVRGEVAREAGLAPAAVEVGLLDEGSIPDLAVTCRGSNHVAIFLGQGGGAFGPARILPTLDRPRVAAPGDVDRDGRPDLVVVADIGVGIHFGEGGGAFLAPQSLVQDPAKLYTDVGIGDVNGDSLPDIVVSETRTTSVLVFTGKGNRQWEAPVAHKVNGIPVSLDLADLDGDKLLDFVTANSSSRSASLLLNQGPESPPRHLPYGLGFPPAGHRMADFNQDGAPDLVAYATTSALILLGRPRTIAAVEFRRGDANADGEMNLTDPITIISRLFLGGGAIPCEDAADADDDGQLNLTDPIAIINRLFLGGPVLPPPGPGSCGEDAGLDALECASGCGG